MRSINPACKFVGLLIPTLLLLLFYMPALNVAVFLTCLLVILLSRPNLKVLAASLVPTALSALALFFTGYRFPSDKLMAHYNLAADTAVWNGLQLSTRVLAFAGLGLLFVLTTDRMELVRSAQQQLRVPVRFAYGLLAAWGILPNMILEYRRARSAFRARGLDPLPWSPALLKPLLVKTVRWSEALAAAMESKGFGSGRGRTEFYVMKVRPADRLFPVLTTALFLGGAALNRLLLP